jgi:hypothetical protein
MNPLSCYHQRNVQTITLFVLLEPCGLEQIELLFTLAVPFWFLHHCSQGYRVKNPRILTFEDGTDNLSRNVDKEIPILSA